jgi:imidazolonepropionase-like amidohydrolase
VPKKAIIITAKGKIILPSFVDTHSHLRTFAGNHKKQVFSYAANLAYGVTATRDLQTGTTDVLAYFDLVKTGEMLGPRAYSTVPGLEYWAYNLKSFKQTQEVLKNTVNFKTPILLKCISLETAAQAKGYYSCQRATINAYNKGCFRL